MLVAVPGPAVTDALQAAGPLDGQIMLDAANSFGQQQQSLRSLADAFPRTRWVRLRRRFRFLGDTGGVAVPERRGQ